MALHHICQDLWPATDNRPTIERTAVLRCWWLPWGHGCSNPCSPNVVTTTAVLWQYCSNDNSSVILLDLICIQDMHLSYLVVKCVQIVVVTQAEAVAVTASHVVAVTNASRKSLYGNLHDDIWKSQTALLNSCMAIFIHQIDAFWFLLTYLCPVTASRYVGCWAMLSSKCVSLVTWKQQLFNAFSQSCNSWVENIWKHQEVQHSHDSKGRAFAFAGANQRKKWCFMMFYVNFMHFLMMQNITTCIQSLLNA